MWMKEESNITNQTIMETKTNDINSKQYDNSIETHMSA